MHIPTCTAAVSPPVADGLTNGLRRHDIIVVDTRMLIIPATANHISAEQGAAYAVNVISVVPA